MSGTRPEPPFPEQSSGKHRRARTNLDAAYAIDVT